MEMRALGFGVVQREKIAIIGREVDVCSPIITKRIVSRPAIFSFRGGGFVAPYVRPCMRAQRRGGVERGAMARPRLRLEPDEVLVRGGEEAGGAGGGDDTRAPTAREMVRCGREQLGRCLLGRREAQDQHRGNERSRLRRENRPLRRSSEQAESQKLRGASC